MDRRLLVHAEHGGMLRRVHVQADDVSGFWIVGGHVTVQPVRLQSFMRSYALHGGLTQPQRFRQLPAGPMSRTIRGFLFRLARNPGLHLRVRYARMAPFVSRIEPGQPFFFKLCFHR